MHANVSAILTGFLTVFSLASGVSEGIQNEVNFGRGFPAESVSLMLLIEAVLEESTVGE